MVTKSTVKPTRMRARHPLNPEIKESQQSAIRSKPFISSYVPVLAGFSRFIERIKKQLHFTDRAVQTELKSPYSHLKDGLHGEVTTLQNLKSCHDTIEELKQAKRLVAESKKLNAELKDNEISADVRAPDLEFLESTLHQNLEAIEEMAQRVQKIGAEQEEINTNFLTQCEDLTKEVQKILKEHNIQMTPQQLEANFIQVLKIFRNKMAIEDREKKGFPLTDEDRALLQSVDLRALSALLAQPQEEKK